MTEPVSIRDFHDADGLQDWRVLTEGASAFYRTTSFAESAALVRAIADLPGLATHPPAVDVRGAGVTVRLITVNDDHFGMTRQDVEIGREISRVARGLGLEADPSALQDLLVIPGAPDTAAVVPFWRAVLGYVPRPDSPDEDLVDPRDRGPAFWFEGMAEPRPGGGGAIHLAVWVPLEEAKARLQAALAAGGRIVRDEYAPSWWTLADAAGNEVDISTTAGRD